MINRVMNELEPILWDCELGMPCTLKLFVRQYLGV